MGKSTKATRVFVADDHGIIREGIITYLNQLDDVEVAGEASDGLSAVKMVEKIKPDVVLMDVSLPTISGIEATKRINSKFPEVKVIGLSMSRYKKDIFDMLKSGAKGYLIKETGLEELHDAILTVMEGKDYLSPMMVALVIDNVMDTGDVSANNLSEKELDVLHWLTEGKTANQVEKETGMSAKEVESHLSGAMDKLGIGTIAELIEYAVQHGFVSH